MGGTQGYIKGYMGVHMVTKGYTGLHKGTQGYIRVLTAIFRGKRVTCRYTGT